MNALLASVIAVAFLVAPRAQDDAKNFEGTWTMVKGEQDGKPLDPETIKTAKLIVRGNHHTVIVGNDKMVGTHHLDPTTKPKSIDVKDTEGPYKGTTLLGIYQLNGDEFTVCFPASGKERPKKFTAKAGTGNLMHTWKRQSAQ